MFTSQGISLRTRSSSRIKGPAKLLLTATPLQNSLLELFGLVSFIDEHAFGDLKSFREQFANLSQEQVFRTLKERLETGLPSHSATPSYRLRPLHKAASHSGRIYASRRRRPSLRTSFRNISDAPNLQALPASQRSLMTLVLRKLLASSTFAIAGALTSISERPQRPR